ncbi:hypothetical protein BS78_05G025300 [Paspalum vaginatum]|nr:hypothetical protein BS78_05G025300 [Paspalum vaginatum]
MSAPPATGPKEVEAVLREEFRLRQALKQGYAKQRGVDVRFLKWRSLSSARGAHLLFRVNLCLDGIPNYAWDADIVERIISRRCALETIETNLLNPEETKTVDLWAWTENLSSIPKKIWLTFTSQARDAKLSSVLVMETPPEHWQKGSTFCVIVHLEEIHDYTAASVDANGNFAPSKRRLPRWYLGVPDGEPRPSRAFERFPHDPSPPRQQHEDRARDGDRRRHQEKEARGVRGRYNNDHPDFERGHRWRRHDDDDGDSDYDRHGRRDYGGRDGRDKHRTGDSVYRERERSPRRRYWGGDSHQGRQRLDDTEQGGDAPQQEFMNKTLALMGQLGSAEAVMPLRNEALSTTMQRGFAAPLVPASGVFNRIFDMLPKMPAAAAPPATYVGDASIEAVEEALKQMELHADLPSAGVLQDHSVVEQQLAPASPTASNQRCPTAGGVDISTLFCKPTPSLLQAQVPAQTKTPTPPAPLRRRQRRVFNMSSEFVAMFNGPLPSDIIAALTEVFNLDDDGANATDEALLNLVGEGLVDLAGEVPMAA